MVVVWFMLECANAPGMDDKCEAMARLGLCNTDRSLLDTCKLSCTRCAPLPSNVSGMSTLDRPIIMPLRKGRRSVLKCGWVQTPQSAGEMKILNSADTKQCFQRRYFCYTIGVKINVDSC